MNINLFSEYMFVACLSADRWMQASDNKRLRFFFVLSFLLLFFYNV